MSEDVPKVVKPSELFRERLVSKLFLESSGDTTLTAFAQLAAFRLNAARALISLLDSRRQYVLAEGTKTLSLQSDLRHGSTSLWLGSVVLPRKNGVCELVLKSPADAALPHPNPGQQDCIVIQNFREHPKFQNLVPIPGTSDLQYYAGVPIKLTDGTIIGAFCIFDDKPHPDLSVDDIDFLHDMAKTTMDHLEAARVRAEHQRRHKLVSGLESFINGFADLAAVANESDYDPLASPGPSVVAQSDVAADTSSADLREHPTTNNETSNPMDAAASSTPLWKLALPAGSKFMFSRAANIIRQSGEYDGVVFFYLSSASSRNTSAQRAGTVVDSLRPERRKRRSRVSHSATASSASQTSTEDPNQAENSPPDPLKDLEPDHTSRQSPCPVLSFSLSPDEISSHGGKELRFSDFKRLDMDKLWGKSPRGRNFVLNRSGQPLPGDTSSSASGVDQRDPANSAKDTDPGVEWAGASSSGRYRRRRAQVQSLKKLSSEARSFVCLPLWDFKRQRWFAYSICWSNSPYRDPGMDGDLDFLRIFGNSIMNALSHIDAISVNQAKTSFVSSISHELRSPLHGLLGAATFLQDSSLDRFQQEMVDSASTSGRTLLDTVDHIMDFAKVDSFALRSQRGLSKNASVSQGADQSADGSLSSTVDLTVLLEEVVDTVLMGFTVQHDFAYADDSKGNSRLQLPGFNTGLRSMASDLRTQNRRGRIRIAFQLAHRQNWCVRTQPGAWRRIIMNLFENALKYTVDGLVTIRLQPLDNVDPENASVALSILDTGKGMSDDYMENQLFMAFSQEDSFASGTGLGLSIVDQVVRSMGGKIHISSSKGVGTNVTVGLTMKTVDPSSFIPRSLDVVDSMAQRIRGLRICILGDPSTGFSGTSASESVETEFSNSLATLLKEWFGVETAVETSWFVGSADLVLCLKPSFKHLASIRNSSSEGTVPPVILIAFDALEMAVLRADARIIGDNSVVEIIAQPVGPRKLARSFQQCLDRQAAREAAPVKTATVLPTRSGSLSKPGPSRFHPPGTPASDSPARSHSSESKATPSGNGPVVLIVDDNQLNLRLLGAFMQQSAIQYQEATNGQDAIDLYMEANGSINYVLMDISMPVMDGITATRRIREFEKASNLERTPIVALTGLTSTVARSEAQDAGMDNFISKPISFEILRGLLPKSATVNSG